MSAAPRRRAVVIALRLLAAALLLGAAAAALLETKADGVNCGSALVPARLEGGALLTGDVIEDDITRSVIRSDCGRLVVRQRFATATLAACGAAAGWWSRSAPRRRARR